MTEFIVISIIVAVFSAVLSYTFIRGAIIAKNEGRTVRFIIAMSFGVIAIVATMATLFSSFFSSEYMLGAPMVVSLLTIPLSWVAMAYVKGWKKFLIFLLPVIPIATTFIVTMAASLGSDLPLKRTEVNYTTQEEIEELLGIGSIPSLKFERAADGSAGKKVWLLLENPSDSTKLCNVFDKLKNIHSLQCEEKDWQGRVYHTVNKNDTSYVNVKFGNDGIFVVYGSIWTIDANNDHFFDSIQAPMPKYEYITYFADQMGPDWYHEQRIRFEQPLSQSWLNKIKHAAKQDSAYSYNEDNKFININFDNSRQYIHMKLYKNLGSGKRIADVDWGDY